MISNKKIVLILSCGLLLTAGNIMAGKSNQAKKSDEVKAVQTQRTDAIKTESSGTSNSGNHNNSVPAINVRPTLPPVLSASPATGEQINWQVISSGGNRAVSTNFILNSTIGQTAVGMASSTNFGLQQGFWVGFSNGCCVNRGNVDDIIGPGGPIDVSDLTYIVNYLFKGGALPPCEEQGNVDTIVGPGGPIDVSDLTYLINYLFKDGSPPPAC